VDGQVVTTLPDGRIVRLPAERIGRLLAIMGDLIETAQRTAAGALALSEAEAPTVIDLEDLLATRGRTPRRSAAMWTGIATSP
jgi:hypothetical protein